MEEEKKKVSEREDTNFQIEPSSIIENIDYEKLAELMSDENFLKQFLESMSSSKEGETKSQTEMTPPDLSDILDNI